MSFIKNISDTSLTDAQLVNQYKRSADLAVLGTLYSRYMDLVFGVCLKYLQNSELAKDAVMQIFEELVQKLARHEVDNFKSWLYTLAKNYCLMQLRSPKQMKTVDINTGLMQSPAELHLNGVMEKEADFRAMEKCMQTLSADQKQGVEMFYLQNKSYKEIAGLTGQDWNKVRSLIQNGKRNLKICMDKASVTAGKL